MSFYEELETLINKYCIESRSNTPDFLLANYLCDCLNAFHALMEGRDKFNSTVAQTGLPVTTLAQYCGCCMKLLPPGSLVSLCDSCMVDARRRTNQQQS